MPPVYDSIVAAEKASVILDIGSAYTKVGFARENGPRHIFKTEIEDPVTGKISKIWDYESREHLTFMLKRFFYKVYFKILNVKPVDRRVVIVESVLCPTLFRDTVAEVLFMHFDVPKMVYVPSHLMSLFTLGISTALVMDIGYSETVVLPIYIGVSMLNSHESLAVGGRHIHQRIESYLLRNAMITTSDSVKRPLSDVLSEPLDEDILEEIKVRTCFVTPRARGLILQAHETRKKIKGTISPDPEQLEVPTPPPDVNFPVNGDKVVHIPGTLREWAAELLFEQDADNKSVSTLILDTLLRCPIDMRKELANNVVLIGGTAMLPGFKHSLLTEIKMLLDDPRYKSRLPLKEIKLHTPPAKENYVAWLGACIYATTESVTLHSIEKSTYLLKQTIPDWFQKNQKSVEKSEKSLV